MRVGGVIPAVIHETPGRIVVVALFSAIPQLCQDNTRQLFAQFHAPLIERVDAPDDSLDKDLVLVERDQGTEATGCQAVEKDAV